MSIGRIDMIDMTFEHDSGETVEITTIGTEFVIIDVSCPGHEVRTCKFEDTNEFRHTVNGMTVMLEALGFVFQDKK